VRKILVSLVLATSLLAVNFQSVSSFTIEPEPNRLVFQNIEYTDNTSVKRPSKGYFRIDNIKQYVTLYAYSDPYGGTIEFKNFPLVTIPDYPIKLHVNSDAVNICSPYQCGKQIISSFSKSNRFTIILTDQAFMELRRNSEAISNFQIQASIGEQNFNIAASVKHFDEFDRGTPVPRDYFDLPYPWNLITSENIGKAIYFGIIIPIFLSLLIVLRHKNESTSLLLLIKFLILILASYLSTIILTKSPDTQLTYNCSWTGYYGRHGFMGLPLPYTYYTNIFGNHSIQTTIISFNYWFWIFALLILTTIISMKKSGNGFLNPKKFIGNNKYFFVIAFIFYILFRALSGFLGVELMC